MKHANPDDFTPVMILGIYKGNPSCQTLNVDIRVGPTTIAGLLTAVVDCMVDCVDEQKQVEFEQAILDTFSEIVKTRFERTRKFYMSKQDNDQA